jgi:hypothetical protein
MTIKPGDETAEEAKRKPAPTPLPEEDPEPIAIETPIEEGDADGQPI